MSLISLASGKSLWRGYCINKMSKSDLQQALYELLCEAPEWLVDRFIYEHVN